MSDFVNVISSTKEKQLLTSMESAIKKANTGMDPNEAIAKTANEKGLSPEFACRMVEAFNTSKTIKHLKDNEGEKRADTFGIASKEEVLKQMYDPKVEKKAHVVVSDAFKFNFNGEPTKATNVLEKAASFKAEKPKVRPLAKTTIKQANSQLDEIKWARRELTAKVTHTKQAALASVDRLGDAFRYSDARSFDEIEEVVRYNLGDELGKQAMDLVWKRGPRLDRMGEKRAEAMPESPRLFGKTASDKAAVEMIELLKQSSEAELALAEFESVATPVEQHIVGLFKQAGRKKKKRQRQVWQPDEAYLEEEAAKKAPQPKPQVNKDPDLMARAYAELDRINKADNPAPAPAPASAPAPAPVPAAEQQPAPQPSRAPKEPKNKDAERAAKAEANAQKQLMTTMTSGKIPFYPEWMPQLISDEAPSVEDVMSPEHEADLRKVKLKLMVNDMISNDPVLSAYAPGEVIDATNQLTAMAPSIATNGPLMKSLVSRFLQQGGKLDPSEIGQILQLESSQRNVGVMGA